MPLKLQFQHFLSKVIVHVSSFGRKYICLIKNVEYSFVNKYFVSIRKGTITSEIVLRGFEQDGISST